jgi:putative hydrolase of the HAD superfamily
MHGLARAQKEPELKPYIFFDAGWTLVFPDYALLDRVASRHGYDVAQDRWERAAAEFTRYYDEARKHGEDRWGLAHFCEWVLERAGVGKGHVAPISAVLQLEDARRSLWSYPYPWVYDTLDRLTEEGYRMSVISNADGRVRAGFQALRLDHYFEDIFDSHIVGYAKPDARLFEYAMEAVGARAVDCLYVGDLYYVDVLGANRAGMAAVHLDPYGLYEGLPGVHVPTVASLPELLAKATDLSSAVFFPLRSEGAAQV